MANQDYPDAPAVEDGGESQGEYILYYEDSLDQAHDEQGYSDEPDSSAQWARLYDLRPTLLQRLWWRSRGLVYLISFSIPLFMLAGLLGLGWITHSDESTSPSAAVSAPSSPESAVVGAWPPEIDFASHTVPAMIRNDLPLAGMQQGYLFHGTAGQFWRITVEPEYGSTLDPQITLYAPSGGMLAQQGGEIALTLPETGAYRLVIESAPPGLTTGEYLLTLFEE